MTDFAFQLCSARNFPSLADTLRMVKTVGYTAVEGYGALYAAEGKVEELTSNLAATGLKMPTGHFSLDMLEEQPGRVLEIASALGLETLYCPYLLPDKRPNNRAGWFAFGQRLQVAGKPFRDAGLGFGWHNHDFEFRRLADGSIPQAAIFEGGPDLEWEADLAWVIKADADPLEWIGTFGKRQTSVHIKDIAPHGENGEEDGWADIGAGTVDWKALMAALRSTPCKYFIMEHDNPSDAKRFAERSIAAARRL